MKIPTTSHLVLSGDINFESARDILHGIHHANTYDEVEKIVITLNSAGGDLYSGFALYDQIRASKKPVDIITTGCCMSAAVLILQAARKRYARKHTIFMVHPPQFSIGDYTPYREFQKISVNYGRNFNLLLELIAERVGMSIEELEAYSTPIQYVDTEMALKIGKNGFIDEMTEEWID